MYSPRELMMQSQNLDQSLLYPLPSQVLYNIPKFLNLRSSLVKNLRTLKTVLAEKVPCGKRVLLGFHTRNSCPSNPLLNDLVPVDIGFGLLPSASLIHRRVVGFNDRRIEYADA
jgi:hypothetical protein